MASDSTLASGPVRIVLVDDHEMVIEGLKAMHPYLCGPSGDDLKSDT